MTSFEYNINDSKYPLIIFNHQTGIFEIKGNSIMVNAYRVYEELLKWIDNYIKKPNKETILNVNLYALNTPTSFYLLEIFRKLISIKKVFPNNRVIINWFSNDEDMHETGEIYKSILTSNYDNLDVEFNIINVYEKEEL